MSWKAAGFLSICSQVKPLKQAVWTLAIRSLEWSIWNQQIFADLSNQNSRSMVWRLASLSVLCFRSILHIHIRLLHKRPNWISDALTYVFMCISNGDWQCGEFAVQCTSGTFTLVLLVQTKGTASPRCKNKNKNLPVYLVPMMSLMFTVPLDTTHIDHLFWLLVVYSGYYWFKCRFYSV